MIIMPPDPFEFDVAIHAGRVLDGRVTYVLQISTLDHAASVRETGIPLEFIERSGTAGGDAFARIVDQLVPALIENMKSSDVSLMPVGLLNVLTMDEILDLMAWLEKGR